MYCSPSSSSFPSSTCYMRGTERIDIQAIVEKHYERYMCTWTRRRSWERTWWIHLRFWHHVLWQWLRHWLEYSYSKYCNLIGQLLGTSARELRRNGTAAHFLSSIADYRPLYTFVTLSFMNLPLLYISQNPDWLVERCQESGVVPRMLCNLRPFHTWPKNRIQCASNVHSSRSHLNPVLDDAHSMRIKSIHLWRWIGTEFIVFSLINDKIMHGYAPTNSNIVEAFASRLYLSLHTRCIRHPRYELQWPIMLGCHWLDAVEKGTAYQVVSCSSSKFTFHIKSTTATR